jgi:hypothetical protein
VTAHALILAAGIGIAAMWLVGDRSLRAASTAASCAVTNRLTLYGGSKSRTA